MKRLRYLFMAAAALLTVSLIGVSFAPKVRAAVRAAFVEVVIPSQPFNDTLILKTGITAVSGPDTGTLGVTSFTISNFSLLNQTVFIFSPAVSGTGGCRFSTVVGGGSPSINVFVPPQQTIQLTYPTPLVFPSVGGHTCLAAQSGTEVDVLVNGFVN